MAGIGHGPGRDGAAPTSDGVVEVVDDHGDVSSLQQLQHAVAADVAGAARHQDLLCHGSLRRKKPQTLQLWGGHSPGTVTSARAPGVPGGTGGAALGTPGHTSRTRSCHIPGTSPASSW